MGPKYILPDFYMKNLAAEKSVVVEHSSTPNQIIYFADTSALRSCNRYYSTIGLEAIKTNYKENVNREAELCYTQHNFVSFTFWPDCIGVE